MVEKVVQLLLEVKHFLSIIENAYAEGVSSIGGFLLQLNQPLNGQTLRSRRYTKTTVRQI